MQRHRFSRILRSTALVAGLATGPALLTGPATRAAALGADRSFQERTRIATPAPAVTGKLASRDPATEKPGQASPPDSHPGVLGKVDQLGGAPYAVEVEGGRAYLGIGPRLGILDVTMPAEPRLIARSQELGAVIEDLEVTAGRAVAAAGLTGLHLLDVRDPAHPKLTSSLATPGPAVAVHVVGDRAYVAMAASGLAIVDLSQAAPTQLGRWLEAGPGSATVRDAFVRGSSAFLAVGEGDLVVLDIADPRSPRRVATTSTGGQPRSVVVADDLAYLAAGDGGLLVMDVSDPAQPVTIATYPTLQPATNVVLAGRRAFVSAGNVHVLDVSDPAAPYEVGVGGPSDTTVPAYDFWAGNVAVSGDHAFVTTVPFGLRIMDVRDPAGIRQIGRLVGFERPWDMQLSGDLLYAAEDRTLTVYDLSDPGSIEKIGSVDSDEGQLGPLEILNGFAYVARVSGSLWVVDVRDPRDLRVVGTKPQEYVDLAQANGVLYAIDGRRLVALDAGSPGVPPDTGELEIGGMPIGLNVSDGFAYVSGEFYTDQGEASSVLVVDVHQPAAMRVVGSLRESLTGWIVQVAGARHMLYLQSDRGLFVYDASDPANLHEVGFFAAPIDRLDDTGLYVAGDRVLMIGKSMYAIDASDPRAPRLVGGHDVVGGLRAGGDLAVTVDGEGLYVFDISDPDGIVEAGSFDVVEVQNAVYAVGSRRYVAAADEGLRVVDYSVRDGLHEVGRYDPPTGRADDVFVTADRAYVVFHGRGYDRLSILDVRDGTRPELLGEAEYGLMFGGVMTGVWVEGNLAYVTGQWGLKIVDVADPRSPRRLSTFYRRPGYGLQVTVRDGLAYLAASVAGLQIVDVSDALNPKAVGELNFGEASAQDVAVAGDVAYVAAGDAGLVLVDIGRPQQPIRLGAVSFPEPVRRVHVSGQHAYLPGGAAGLHVVDVSDPRAPKLVQELLERSGTYVLAAHSAGPDLVVGTADSGLHMFSYWSPSTRTSVYLPLAFTPRTGAAVTPTAPVRIASPTATEGLPPGIAQTATALYRPTPTPTGTPKLRPANQSVGAPPPVVRATAAAHSLRAVR